MLIKSIFLFLLMDFRNFLFYLLFILLIIVYPAHAQNFADTFSTSIVNDVDSLEEDDEGKVKDTSIIRTIPHEEWKKLTDDKAFIYAHKKEKKPTKISPPFFNIIDFFTGSFFKFILFLLIGGLLIMVIYHLFFTGDNHLFYKRKQKIKNIDASFENIEVFSEWDLALQNALSTYDYRLAIRIHYLQTLQNLKQAELIQYEYDRTNWDYVNQLANSTLHQPFALLTRYFDYIWYGRFLIDRNQYDQIEELYRKFQQDIK
jgi:hypothetical protein